VSSSWPPRARNGLCARRCGIGIVAGRSTRSLERMKVSIVAALIAVICGATFTPRLVGAVCLDPKSNGSISGYHVPLDEEIRSTPVIAIGEVISNQNLTDGPDGPDFIAATIYTIRIERVLKGRLPRQIELRNENDSGRYPIGVGERHVLFLRPLDPRFGAGYWADSCGNSAQLPSGESVVKRVQAQLGKRGHAL